MLISRDIYYVYILYSAVVDCYYVGQTSNLEDRLKRHNQGRSKYTKSGIPWKLMYKETFENRSEAMKREKQIKSGKNREALRRLIHSTRNQLVYAKGMPLADHPDAVQSGGSQVRILYHLKE